MRQVFIARQVAGDAVGARALRTLLPDVQTKHRSWATSAWAFLGPWKYISWAKRLDGLLRAGKAIDGRLLYLGPEGLHAARIYHCTVVRDSRTVLFESLLMNETSKK